MKKAAVFIGALALSVFSSFAGGKLVVGVVESCPTGGIVQVGRAYVQAVESAGFVPMVLPMTQNEATIQEYIEKIDILLLAGGEDVAPSRYGEKDSPRLGRVNFPRDAFEWKLLTAARRARLPIFGICRGEQMINVFFGGTLYQDIPSEFPRARNAPEIVHRAKTARPAHSISVKCGTRFGAVVGAGDLLVNTYHHQSVKDPAPGFIVSAVSPDGVVEAIESLDYPAAGVQFHPEKILYQNDGDFNLARMSAIFSRLPELVGKTPLRPQSADCRPETWFHIIGGNVSKAGITADLEALKAAGFGGIQFFHGQLGEAEVWDGVGEQIPCLSAKWDDLVRHTADECARLGLSFKMQNCPGWSMSGGPWIAPSNAMRKLVFARQDIDAVSGKCVVPDIPVPPEYTDADSDWHDICRIAFPTPAGGAPVEPVSVATNGNCREFVFSRPVTIRTLELPPPNGISRKWTYTPDVRVVFEARVGDGWRKVCDIRYPQGCWQDNLPFSVACSEASSDKWRFTLTAPYETQLRYVRFLPDARLDNYEGLAAHVLRGRLKREYPVQSSSAYIPAGAVRMVEIGERLPAEISSRWTVLRIGHVNMKQKNGPAPAEATGWECDKLDSRGIKANFDGYIGRLANGPLKGGKLKGMIVDSWECGRQTWTWRMEEYFRAANGYDVKSILPAVFGWVIGSPEKTEKALWDWRRTIGDLIENNYYRTMAELAHANGLEVAYETAFGDVVPGDILSYWKWCDTPMCEFWLPYALEAGGVGHPNYKPVRPCVSAAHLYGKNRVACESFTSMDLSWDENFRDMKEQAVRHYVRGVTHLVFHTCTHNPQTDGRVPGTSFGSIIGTPFVRGQTWWRHLRAFTGWTEECCRFLERGKPVIDALRYLGDEIDHKPDELEYFPEGFKNDYLNADVLFNRLNVENGRFVLPDGMSYSVIWVPESVTLLPRTRRRLDELSMKGGRVHFGSADGAVVGMEPQIEYEVAGESGGKILWYHRVDGGRDCYFVAADDKGFSGQVTFRTAHGKKTLALELAPYETLLLEFSASGVVDLAPNARQRDFSGKCRKAEYTEQILTDWLIEFPAGWGAPESLRVQSPVWWKDLPGMPKEGRAFSGTAVYTAVFEAGVNETKGGGWLDLGAVRDVAKVYVNGHEAALLWAWPYGCDLTRRVRPGRNEIRIEVTSSWFNRLAWDFVQPPKKRKTWTIWNLPMRTPPCLKKGARLRESGLSGPVKIKWFR